MTRLFTPALLLAVACATTAPATIPATARFESHRASQVFDRSIRVLNGYGYAIAQSDRAGGTLVTAPNRTMTDEPCGLGECEVRKSASVAVSQDGLVTLHVQGQFRPSVRTTVADEEWKPAWTAAQAKLLAD